MKTKRSIKCSLALLLSLVMMFSVMTPMMAFTASAITVDTSNIGSNTKLTSKTDYAVAPGITESHIITHNKDGSNQVQAYALEVDLSNPNVGILASYKNYMNNLASSPSWGFQTVRDQAVAAEKYYQMYDSNFDVVGGINGDYFNMQVGNPTGPLIMNGETYNKNNKWNYFAILDDGSAVIGSGTVPSNAKELVGGPSILIKDGKIVADPNNGDMYPRTSVGITAEGKVIFITADGRQAPYSCGQTLYENAQQMLSLGCVDAIQLDGGGSATIVSQREGEESLSVRNSPSDGSERTVSTALLVYTTAAPDGVFDHANISPNNELYTPGSTVTFTATGVDGSGAAVELPAEGVFALADEAAGTIDSATGVYTPAEGYTGEVTVNYMVGGAVKGSTTVFIVVPDELYVSGTEQAVGPGVTTDFGIVAKYQDRDVTMKAGDIAWTIVDQTSNADLNGTAGTFDGLTFTSAEDNAYNATVTATLVTNSELSVTIKVFIGSKQTLLYDFEYTTNEEEAASSDTLKYISSYTLPNYGSKYLATMVNPDLTTNDESPVYYTPSTISEKLRKENMPLFMWPNGSIPLTANDAATATIVSAEDGEPVRFGEKSLRISFDFSSYDTSSNGNFYLRSTDALYAFEGSPTAIGVWVYAPEGTAGYALYINCATNVDAENNSYSNSAYTKGDKIDWVGWKYLELDLTGASGHNFTGSAYEPFGEGKGCGIFWISYQPANMGKPTADSIYIDQMTLIYGANTSDTNNPEISYVGTLTEDMVDGETVYTSNTVTFKAQYADVEDKYMTGIDDAATKMYIDGVDVTDKCYINEGDDEIYIYDAYLANGTHCIQIEVADAYSNKTTETRYFTVKGEDSNTEFDFVEVDGDPVLGEKYSMAVVSNNIDDIDTVEMEVKVLSDYTRYWNKFEIVAADGFELEGEPVFNDILSTIKFTVKKTSDVISNNQNTENAIVYVNVDIPTNVPEGLEATYRISTGKVTFASEKNEKYVTGFSGKITTTCISPFNISIDTMIVGSEGGYMTVTDTNGNAAANVNIYYGEEIIGTTDENGQIFTNKFINEVVKFTVYAEKDGQVSFEVTTQSLLPGGDANGAPTNIILNAVSESSTSQSIAWMASPLASDSNVIVKYAKKADYESKGADAFTTVNAESYISEIAASGDINTNYAVRFNSVLLTGLETDTEYVYIVGDGTNMSEIKSFTTVRKGAAVNFFVLGDTQSADTSNVEAIFKKLASDDIDYDFGIQTGDAVDNAGRYSYWEGIGEVFSSDFIGETAIVHVLGNHEYTGDATATSAAKYFTLPGTADENAPLCYSVQYGNVYIAAINYASLSDYKEAAEWLVEDANNSTANWKLLTMHQPAYFTNAGANSTEMREVISSAVDAADIDFVFSGHDHSYARTYPVTAGAQDENGAVYYICAATSPEKGYQITTVEGVHAIATDEYNAVYLTVSVTDTTFTVTTWNYEGDVTSSTTVTNEETGEEETVEVTTPVHTVFDTYTATKAVTCTDKGHDYVLENGWLICSVCGYTIPVEGYTGLAKDPETVRLMNIVDGVAETSKWVEIEGNVYYLDENGVAVAGEQKIGEYTYNFDENGKLTKFALVNDGALVTNNWYGNQYLGADGLFVTGEQTIDGKTYTFDDEGNFVKGALVKEGNYTYYYIAGEKQRNWHQIDGYWYYFDRQTGFGMATLDSDGKLSFDKDKDGKYPIENMDGTLLLFSFDKQGRLVGGAWSKTENGTVYYWANNERLTGLQEIDGVLYYFGSDYYMIVNDSAEVDGVVYAFDENGQFIHYEDHVDTDENGECDHCESRSRFTDFIKKITAFIEKIKNFFTKLFK